MSLNRRQFMALSAGLAGGIGQVHAQPADGWYPIRSDEGVPIQNLRLPVELTAEVDELPGLIRVGSDAPEVTIVEFYDYNCPFCRKAAGDLEHLVSTDKGLRLGLVNNPVLSAQSREAAQIELAVLRLRGSKLTYDFHKRLNRASGRISGEKATAVALELGLTRDELTRAATGGARALAIMFVLAAFLVAPFFATTTRAQAVTTSHITQIISSPSKTNNGCPKKRLPGQPNACASSSVPVAGFDNRAVTLPPLLRGSSIAPPSAVTLAPQFCGAPPDRPPRFPA